MMNDAADNIEAMFALTPSTVLHTCQTGVPVSPSTVVSQPPTSPKFAHPAARSSAAIEFSDGRADRKPEAPRNPKVFSTITTNPNSAHVPRPMALPFLLPAAKPSTATRRSVDIALGRMDNGGEKIRYDRPPHLLQSANPADGYSSRRVRLAGHTSLVTIQVPKMSTSRAEMPALHAAEDAGDGRIDSTRSEMSTMSAPDNPNEEMVTVQTSMYSADRLLGVIEERYEPSTRLWQHLLEMLTQPTIYGKQVVRFAQDEQRVSEYEIVVLDPDMMAHLWGVRRGCSRMTYEKLSRSLRYYAPRDILHKSPRRLHWVLGSRLIDMLGMEENKERVRWVGADLPDKWKYQYLGEIRKEHDKKNSDRKKIRLQLQNGFASVKADREEEQQIAHASAGLSDEAFIVDED